MEQRLLRLGDIVDDYCPRERRVTNHAIVAIVENAIRQTRCTTCDHEHEFKQAREPRRRKKSESLYDDVLAGVDSVPLARAAAAQPAVPSEEPASVGPDPADAEPSVSTPEDAWPAHRTLIRATLPKIEGEPPPPRPIPEFTMHQRPQAQRGRGFRFNHGQQGDPFGYPRDGRPERGAPGNGRGPGPRNGNTSDPGNGQGNGNGQGRRRRRRGKRGR